MAKKQTVKQLRKQAKAAGIEGYGSMNKGQLLKALAELEKPAEPESDAEPDAETEPEEPKAPEPKPEEPKPGYSTADVADYAGISESTLSQWISESNGLIRPSLAYEGKQGQASRWSEADREVVRMAKALLDAVRRTATRANVFQALFVKLNSPPERVVMITAKGGRSLDKSDPLHRISSMTYDPVVVLPPK